MRWYDKDRSQWQKARSLRTGQVFWVMIGAPDSPYEGAPHAYMTNYRWVEDSDAVVFMPASAVELLPEFAEGYQVEWQWRWPRA